MGDVTELPIQRSHNADRAPGPSSRDGADDRRRHPMSIRRYFRPLPDMSHGSQIDTTITTSRASKRNRAQYAVPLIDQLAPLPLPYRRTTRPGCGGPPAELTRAQTASSDQTTFIRGLVRAAGVRGARAAAVSARGRPRSVTRDRLQPRPMTITRRAVIPSERGVTRHRRPLPELQRE